MLAEYAFPIAAIVVLVVVNGLFVAAEFALVGARLGRLKASADRGSKAAAWLVEVFEREAGKDSYIAVAQLGITLASIGLGMYGEPAVAHWLYDPLERLGVSETASHTLGFVIALSAITFLHVVVGEMIPKALALQAPEAVSIRLNLVMRTFSAIFRPMVVVLNSIAFALMRLLRIPEPDKRLSLHTSDELAIVTDESAHGGQLGQRQRDLIRNIFDLDERRAEEIMIARSAIVSLDVSATIDEVASVISGSQRSRYPVVDGDLDHVVGFLHIKDFIRANRLRTLESISDITRPLPVVAATTSAEELLDQFKQGNTHAALVIDEFGSTAGFVSLDDVIAEVMDEQPHDVLTQLPDGSMTVPGELALSAVREALDEPSFEHDDAVTIAGLLLAIAGEVPEVGHAVRHDDFELTVRARDGRRITEVGIRRV